MSEARSACWGLGIMGSGMARRLLANGFALTVFNRNAEKAKPLAVEGAHVAASPREAASRAEVIVSMLADDPASRGLWLGENGALAGAAPGTVCIECSTVTVGWIQAASGELNFLVGGSAATLEKARPILAAMSKSITPLGPVGSGALLKLIN